MSSKFLKALLVTTSLMSPCAAWAQTGAAVAAPATRAADEPASQNDREIVVTAQKRSERLVDVPITVSSVDGQQLEAAGVNNLSKLSEVVPALRFDHSGSYGQLSIRGVGTALSGPGVGAAVGTYVDGFLVPTPQNSAFDLLNVNNVQVLKGPQGTLFGRNTTAGAILITTSDPSSETAVRGKLSYARFDTREAALYGTTGIGERVAVDLAGNYRHTDGFIHNIVEENGNIGKRTSITFRAGIKFDLGGDNSILARYLYQDVDDSSVDAYGLYQGVGLATVIAPGIPVATRRGVVALDGATGFRSKTNAGFVTGRFDLGFASLSSYTMYRDEKSTENIDLDNSSLPLFHLDIGFRDKVTTQELNLNSKPGGPLSWVAGLYYFHHDSVLPKFASSSGGSPYGLLFSTGNEVTSYAAFADATYEMVPSLFVTGGLRYSHEKNNAFYDLAVPDAATGQPAGFYSGKADWENVTPRVVLRYQINQSSNIYASLTKGFKAGFINANGLSVEPVKPEKITSIEGGYKLTSGPFRFNVSAFHYRYKGLQIVTLNGTQAIVSNAAKSTLYGGEFDLSAAVTDHFDIALAGAYTHSEYDSYANAPVFVQFLADPTSPIYGLFINSSVDASGFQMSRAPKFSGNASLTYKTAVAGGELALNGNFSYQSKFYFDPSHQYPQKSYGLLNLRATWTDAADHWSLSVFGNNVTDKTYRKTTYGTPFGAGEAYGDPVTYGAELAFRF